MSMDKVTTAYKVMRSECENFIAATGLDFGSNSTLCFTKHDLEDYISMFNNSSKYQAQTLLTELRIGNIEYLVVVDE